MTAPGCKPSRSSPVRDPDGGDGDARRHRIAHRQRVIADRRRSAIPMRSDRVRAVDSAYKQRGIVRGIHAALSIPLWVSPAHRCGSHARSVKGADHDRPPQSCRILDRRHYARSWRHREFTCLSFNSADRDRPPQFGRILDRRQAGDNVPPSRARQIDLPSEFDTLPTASAPLHKRLWKALCNAHHKEFRECHLKCAGFGRHPRKTRSNRDTSSTYGRPSGWA